MQNDTGSGIVLGSFLFVLYREGLNKWLCIPVLLIAALSSSRSCSPLALLVLLLLVCTFSEAKMNGIWRSRLIYLAALLLGALVLWGVAGLAAPGAMDFYRCLLIATLVSLVPVAVSPTARTCATSSSRWVSFSGRWSSLPTTDYIFNSILRQHQRDRILSFLGIINDPLGTDYNVNQAKIAIGSGGLAGKGFLPGHADQVRVPCPSAIRTSSSAPWARSGDSSAR